MVALKDTINLTFWYPHSGKKCKIKCIQLPILPALAMTAHKSQGQTMEKAIVDLEGCSGSESSYICTSLDSLAILCSFSKKRITCRPSDDSCCEQHRLHLCNLLTMKQFGNAKEQKCTQDQLANYLTLPPLNTKCPKQDMDIFQQLLHLEALQTICYDDPSLVLCTCACKCALPEGSCESSHMITYETFKNECSKSPMTPSHQFIPIYIDNAVNPTN